MGIRAEQAVDKRIAALRSDDVRVRVKAVRALQALGGDTARKAVAGALEDEWAEVRAEAAWAIGRWRDVGLLPLLVALAADPDGRAREAAARALGRVVAPAFAGALLPFLVNEVESSVRRAAAGTLFSVVKENPGAVPARVIDALPAALRDRDPVVLDLVSRALGALGGAATTALLEAARDSETRVRRTIFLALGLGGAPGAVDALLAVIVDPADPAAAHAARGLGLARDPRAFAPLLLALDRGPTPKARDEILRALTAIGPAALPELILALDDPRAQVRRHAAKAFIEAPDERAAAALCHLLSDGDPTVRWEAVHALQRLRSPHSVDALCAALADPHPGFRREVAAALRVLPDPRAAPHLLLAAADTNPSVSWEAARALVAMRDEGATDRLGVLAWSPTPEVAQEAMTALCERGDDAVLPIAIARLAERGRGKAGDVIRWYATDALGRIGGDEAVAALCDALTSDPCTLVREGALTALARIQNRAALGAVGRALDDQEASVRRWAAYLLTKFGDVSVETRVLAALVDTDPDVRAFVCVALGGATSPVVRAALVRVARRDPSRRVQRRAKSALKRTPAP